MPGAGAACRFLRTGSRRAGRPGVHTTRRLCRFCGLGAPQVTFKNRAHAVSESLGNRSLFADDECDACNDLFGRGYEHHLGLYTTMARAAAQVPGKRGVPTFQSADGGLTMETTAAGLHIHVNGPGLTAAMFAGPDPPALPLRGVSPPSVPVRAAQAVVRYACSVCPAGELSQCRPAIDLLRRGPAVVRSMSVLHAFTPGGFTSEDSEVLPLRRRGAGPDPEPYFWSVLQSAHVRLQFFVPLCPADAHLVCPEGHRPIRVVDYPSKFGPDRGDRRALHHHLDWSGTTPKRAVEGCEFQATRVERVAPPAAHPGGPA